MLRSLILSLGLFGGISSIDAISETPVFVGQAHAENSAAPGFTLRDINKKKVSLSDYKGKVVLINFWATWCQPCQAELPHLQELYDDLKDDGFEVLAISIDEARDASKVKPLIRKGKFTFTVLLDKKTQVIPMYNPDQTLPYNALVDQEGKLVWTKFGYAPGEEKMIEEKVMELLGKKDEVEDGNIEEVKPKETEPKD